MNHKQMYYCGMHECYAMNNSWVVCGGTYHPQQMYLYYLSLFGCLSGLKAACHCM